MSAVFSIRSEYGNEETTKSLIVKGLNEEKEKINYVIEISKKKIADFEKELGLSTKEFLKKFNNGEIEESQTTFEWWSETKLLNELSEKLKILNGIEM